MKMSMLHCPTLKEAPREAEVPSHNLMLRAGYIRKEAAGIYSFLPLAVRSVQKISRIVQEELNAAGAQEVLLPTIQPAELWEESGRWEQYGPELLRVQDRKGADFCYAPTAEEVIVALVRRDVTSYRQLPVNLYQIATKFRDEIRPRAGLMRGREFIMKDGYSFDVDDEAAGKTYDAMYDAYHRIFERCGLAFRPVEADTGAIGGSRSHEFQVLAETGEDSIVSCGGCNYTANVEKAEVQSGHSGEQARGEQTLSTTETPGTTTVDEVATFLKTKPANVVKTLLFMADGAPVAALIRGDLELNEFKLKAALGADELEMANATTVEELTGAPVGFAGPVELAKKGVRIVADHSLGGMKDFVCGANAKDMHHVGVNLGVDFSLEATSDLRVAQGGDPCGRCGEEFQFFRGIEVGHVFFLGTKYSEAMKCNYSDSEGGEHAMVMGCYGIGITRILAAAIEQNHDKFGIQWPVPLAPFEAVVLPLNQDDDEVREVAQKVYEGLKAAGIEVLIDDRDMRPGAKFNDSDLIGFPYQLVVGKRGLKEGAVEVKNRRTNEKTLVPVNDAVDLVSAQIVAAREGGSH